MFYVKTTNICNLTKRGTLGYASQKTIYFRQLRPHQENTDLFLIGLLILTDLFLIGLS
jgi:hypothetical protein